MLKNPAIEIPGLAFFNKVWTLPGICDPMRMAADNAFLLKRTAQSSPNSEKRTTNHRQALGRVVSSPKEGTTMRTYALIAAIAASFAEASGANANILATGTNTNTVAGGSSPVNVTVQQSGGTAL